MASEQNPLSFVAPGKSLGAATILPYKPFDPMAFLAADKKLEWQREQELARQQDRNLKHNMSWYQKATKYDKDYWHKYSENIQSAIDQALEATEEIYAEAELRGEAVSGFDNLRVKPKWDEIHQLIAKSKRDRKMYEDVTRTISSNPRYYDHAGLELLEQDLQKGDISSNATDYIIKDEPISSVDMTDYIVKTVGVETFPQGDYNITRMKRPSEISVKELRKPTSLLMRGIGRQWREEVENGTYDINDENAKKKYYEDAFNDYMELAKDNAVDRISRRTQVVIDRGQGQITPEQSIDDYTFRTTGAYYSNQGYYSDSGDASLSKLGFTMQYAMPVTNVYNSVASQSGSESTFAPSKIGVAAFANRDIKVTINGRKVFVARGQIIPSMDDGDGIQSVVNAIKQSGRNPDTSIVLRRIVIGKEGNNTSKYYILNDSWRNNLRQAKKPRAQDVLTEEFETQLTKIIRQYNRLLQNP